MVDVLQKKRRIRSGACSLLLVCSASPSCTGAITDPATPAPVGPGSPLPGIEPGHPGEPSPDTGLWRLTKTEYANTLRDLLGATASAVGPLSEDANAGGFDNHADILSTTDVEVGTYDDIANQVVDTAFGDLTRRGKLLAAGGCAGGSPTEACARKAAAAFARRAWRRPVADDEVTGQEGVMTLALGTAREQGDGLEDALKLAFRMVLTAPQFLFRVEADPPGSQGLHRVSAHELATRLSYLVWSSTPDDELLALADDARLSDAAVVSGQLERLLRDPKADALVTNFAAQWMSMRTLASASPDPKVLRYWKEELRQPMIAETLAFFREFLHSDDLPVAGLLESGFTFANEVLAKHYGSAIKTFPAATGPQMQRVELAGNAQRFGLLSQAGILTATSKPDRTSPVNRGKWVLSRLLCQSPGKPPANVPSLDDTSKKAALPANATIRARMEVGHSKDPVCVACHATMDSIGFAFEHYDAIGMWRNAYPVNSWPSNAIDSRGTLPDGFEFSGADSARQLSDHLRNDPRFPRCFAQNLFAYAMGREPSAPGDQAILDQLGGPLAKSGVRVRDVIAGIVSSQAFQFRGVTP